MNGVLTFLENLAEARRMSRLYALSDHHLKARGMTRKGLQDDFVKRFSAR